MTGLKTKPNQASVESFLNNISDAGQKSDCRKLMETMRQVTGEAPKMWGNSIVGFGSYHYKYPTGREGDWFVTGFSPRKQNLSIYILPGLEKFEAHLADLGKYKTGKSCLYVKKLSDINFTTLSKMIGEAVDYMNRRYNS